jgi:hypothetical protein
MYARIAPLGLKRWMESVSRSVRRGGRGLMGIAKRFFVREYTSYAIHGSGEYFTVHNISFAMVRIM